MRTLLTSEEIARATTRISHEILESNHGTDSLVLLGIPTRGATLARRLWHSISTIEKLDESNSLGSLDITMYRDDLRSNPNKTVSPSTIPASGIDDKVVVLVDHVLYSGRTIRAALDALNDFGRPRIVRLAVLVDRGHRELPIRADFVGKNLPTSREERIFVRLQEHDGKDEVVIE